MTDQWYFGRDGQRFGPFSAAQLKEQGALGKLQPTNTVWKSGIDKGMPAERVKNLFPAPQAAAAPANANAPATAADASAQQPSPGLSPATLDPAPATGCLLPKGGPGNQDLATARLEPWIASAPGQGTLEEPLQEIIPDGLMLKPIPEQNDSAFLLSPASIHAPGSEKIKERDPETSTVLTGATDQRPQSPGHTDPHRPITQPPPKRKARVTEVRGAIITSQDGEVVQYRKKCSRCAREDSSRSSMRIQNGVRRDSFFCPKCRKVSEVLIHGVT